MDAGYTDRRKDGMYDGLTEQGRDIKTQQIFIKLKLPAKGGLVMPSIPPANIKYPNVKALFDSSTDSMHSIMRDVIIIPSARENVMTYVTNAA